MGRPSDGAGAYTGRSMQSTSPSRGRFITLEGPDGAGKSTQADLLAASLRSLGHAVRLVREPGGTALGERVRELLLSSDALDHRPASDALLFNAARSQLVYEIIRPALARGEIVLCDRFADSTLAYQGYGEGLEVKALRSLGEWATGGLAPDLTLLLDLSEDAGVARQAARAAGSNRFEAGRRDDGSFQRRVRQGFLTLARAEPHRWQVFDAAQPVDVVARRILEVVRERLSIEPSASAVRMNR